MRDRTPRPPRAKPLFGRAVMLGRSALGHDALLALGRLELRGLEARLSAARHDVGMVHALAGRMGHEDQHRNDRGACDDPAEEPQPQRDRNQTN